MSTQHGSLIDPIQRRAMVEERWHVVGWDVDIMLGEVVFFSGRIKSLEIVKPTEDSRDEASWYPAEMLETFSAQQSVRFAIRNSGLSPNAEKYISSTLNPENFDLSTERVVFALADGKFGALSKEFANFRSIQLRFVDQFLRPEYRDAFSGPNIGLTRAMLVEPLSGESEAIGRRILDVLEDARAIRVMAPEGIALHMERLRAYVDFRD